ncbi:hypothetical protein ACKXGF_02905 [Alkalibacillus sp. S2W]|uniref:hypothetical protein n=1 Tax=Alkalibacillus sp. S2W TaxID=3386553 RepID=UPI00398D52DC
MEEQQIKIDSSVMNTWIDCIATEFDLFFFSSANESLIKQLGSSALIMNYNNFLQSEFHNKDTVNFYETWNLKEGIEKVCIVHLDIFPTLPKNIRKYIIEEQIKLNRGLIFNWNFVKELLRKVPEEKVRTKTHKLLSKYTLNYNDEKFLLIHAKLWEELHYNFKYHLILRLSKEYISNFTASKKTYKLLANKYPHISSYFNSYPEKNGANCFAATLAAISGAQAQTDWLIYNWVDFTTFHNGIELNQYKKVSISFKELEAEDLIIWMNKDGVTLHATFHLGYNYFFNKNGQSFILPWEIISLEELLTMWGKDNIMIYRKQ